ncbi:MAG: oligoendopeptidase F [Calditrichaceae bacterium]
MKRFIGVCLMFILFFTVVSSTAGDMDKTRDKIADKYKWDLTDLFKSNDDWKASKTELEGMIGEIGKYKGTLAKSADQLYECLELTSDVWKKYLLLSGYASKLSDQDTRKSGPLGMTQEIGQTGTKLSAATSFIDPEILAIDIETIKEFMKEKPELKEYAHYIDDIQRLKPHTRSAEVEEVISQAGLMSDTPYDVYGIFKNADMPRPEVELADGEKVRLDDAAYTLHRAGDDRDMRIKVFEEFFGAYKQYERSFGTQLYSEVKKDMFYKNVRNYSSSLESALNANNIPVAVYKNLINSVHENLPTLYRYLELRKKMLGIDELHYYDMYPSLVKEVDLSYTVEEAEDVIKKALQPLGSDYIATLDEAFNNRWIDMYPNTGKRSGAYSSGSAYDVHPYILMNYNGQYDDVSTLAHELGHTMHSYYSNKNQTFMNSHYPIFLAEVASISNETLLIDHVLKGLNDSQERLSILGSQLETFRTTLFRQTQFAEFEMKIHDLAEAGEALTGEKLTNLYLDILKTYYGHEQGITVIDDLYGIEWAYIPHFYYNFYVFQYSTSLCAATAVAEKILDEDSGMREKYVKEFLSAGGSDYAIPILKNIGVDMTTTEPYEMAFAKMNKIMDEIEEILAKQ